MIRVFSRKRLLGIVAYCAIISSAFVFLSCGGSKQPGFNIDVGQLKTNIDPTPYDTTVVLSPPWGSGDGRLGNRNPYTRGDPESGAQPAGPSYFHADSEGRIYIVDSFHGRTVLFDQSGNFIRNYSSAMYIASDNEGNAFFSRPLGDFFVYDSDGNLIGYWNYNQKPEGWSDDEWFAGDRPVIGNDDCLYMIGEREIDSQNRRTITKWTKDGSPVSSFILDTKEYWSDVAIDEGGRIFTNEGGKIEVFDPQGKHIKTILVDRIISDFLGFDKDGNLSFLIKEPDSKNLELFKYNSEGTPIACYRLDNSQIPLDYLRVNTPCQLSKNGDLFLMTVPAYSKMDKETLKIYRVDLP